MSRWLRRILRSAGLAPMIRIASLICGSLSWQRAQALGSTMGSLVWRLGGRRSRRTLENLTIAFPELSAAEREQIGRDSFRHLGTSACELLHMRMRSPAAASSHVRVKGFEEIERLRELGKPILILTGHCGNWELISTANHSHGLGLVAMTRELDSSAVQELAVDMRAHLGSETIARGSKSSSRQLLRTLRSGGTLAFLIDQDLDTDGVFVPFFGRLAYTPVAVANLAQRLGAEVVPTFSERLPDGSHLVCFHSAVDLPADAAAATALLTARIEEQIRRYPAQWVWIHRRWRRRPPEETGSPWTAGEAGLRSPPA